MSVNETTSRAILTKATSVDPLFWTAFSLDAYESTPSTFLNNFRSIPLKIKTNAVHLLQKRLAQHRPLRDVVSLGLKGDPYDVAEKHYRLTRGLLETLASYDYPVHLISNASLLLDDLDLLQMIAKESFLHITVPIWPLDPLYERLYGEQSESRDLIRKLRLALPEVHISLQVRGMVPGLGDDTDSIEHLLQKYKQVGISSVHFSFVESLSTKQTQLLLDLVMDAPEVVEKWVDRFHLEMDDGVLYEGSMTINATMRQSLATKVGQLAKKYHLLTEAPRYIPKDYRYSNYLLSERLFKRAYEKALQGDDTAEIIEVAQAIQSLDHAVTKAELKAWAKCEGARRDIDYFLFQGELKSYGQKTLFE